MVIQLVRASVKPDQREEWLGLVSANAAQTRNEAGCLGFEIGEDLGSPNTFLLIERWADLAAQYEHFRQPSFAPLMEKLGGILAEPPEIEVHEVACSMTVDEVLAAAGAELNNVATIRGIYEAFGRGDVQHILDQLNPEVQWHAPPSVPFSKGIHRGPAEVAQFFGGIAEHVSEPSVETYEFISAGDRVIVLACFRGRGATTGVPFEAPEAHVWKLSGGKVVEERSYADTAAIVQALAGSAAVAR